MADTMNHLVFLSVVTVLAVLSSCKKEPNDAGAPDKKLSQNPPARADTASQPVLPAVPPAEEPHLAPAPPARSKELADALALADPAEREAAINLVLRDLPTASAADLVLADLPADPVLEKILGSVLTKFAIEEPSAAAAWLSAAPEFSGKATATHATADLWQRTDFGATMKWIDSLPAGANRQRALEAIAGHISISPVGHRLQELDAIGNPQLRAEVEAITNAKRVQSHD